MDWQMPWYSALPSVEQLLVGREVGLFHLVCYVRDGDRVFETYWTVSYTHLDVYKRQAARAARV